MFARFVESRRYRRGVVLVLILGMLGLLAVVGVTFATFSGQSKVGALNFAQGVQLPGSGQVMDFALSQLINDTNLLTSAIRGHSLTRDMYGNDGRANGALAQIPAPYGFPLFNTGVRTNPNPGPLNGLIQVRTNIPIGTVVQSLYGVNFSSWILRMNTWTGINPNGSQDPNIANSDLIYYPAQTYEIVQDDDSGSDPFCQGLDIYTGGAATIPMHLLTLGSYDVNVQHAKNNNKSDFVNLGGVAHYYSANPVLLSTPFARDPANLFQPLVPLTPATDSFNNPVPFTLDGRFRRAFNGTGMAGLNRVYTDASNNTIPIFAPQYGNFIVNGQILNPTINNTTLAAFPGDPTFVAMDEDYDAVDLENWFLAIQSADGSVVIPSFHRPGIVSAADWQSTAANNTNWVLSAAKILRPRAVDHANNTVSFPDLLPDPVSGKINYDVDNDGDGTTDSVWLDLGYTPMRDPSGKMFKPLFAFTVLGMNGRMPLNSVGNIQARDPLNMYDPAWDHASHLGYSVSEINPKYALQNAFAVGYDQADNGGGTPNSGVDVSITQLRNLLTGTRPQNNLRALDGNNADANFVRMGVDQNGNPVLWYMPNNVPDAGDLANGNGVARSTVAVQGRWGDPQNIPNLLPDPSLYMPTPTWPNFTKFNTTVRAGRSPRWVPPTASPPYPFPPIDATDDDYTSLDFWSYPLGSGPESADHYDKADSTDLAAERIRRYVDPIDAAGTGAVVDWNLISSSTSPTLPYGLGSDTLGRVSFMCYFRPPGLPDEVGRFGAAANAGPDTTNNKTHGFESRRYPVTPAAAVGMVQPYMLSNAAPYQVGTTQTPPQPPGGTADITLPTFDGFINSQNNVAAAAPFTGNVVNGYNGGSLGRDVADEMNLYGASQFDAPYGATDLEWLYRKEDTDGASLDSRLSKLAPISFLNPIDGFTRRRFFSTDTWETTNYAYANDNPIDPTNPANLPFASNSRFAPSPVISPLLANASLWVSGVPSPSIAHRERKINLNFPLPPSNNPREQVRQKWITETYRTLKGVLPPQSLDTPEELAQLSQFIINIVDYRDTDGTITVWTNPDLLEVPAWTDTTATPNVVHPPSLMLASATAPVGAPTPIPLIQYGMEYCPVALNEALGFLFSQNSTSTGSPTAQEAGAMFVELVNTLTADGGSGTQSNLALKNWELLLMPDEPMSRPDPATGQVPVNSTGMFAGDTSYVANTVNPPATQTGEIYNAISGHSNDATDTVGLVNSGGTASPIPALSATATLGSLSGSNYYVLDNFVNTFGAGAPASTTNWPITVGATSTNPISTANPLDVALVNRMLKLTNQSPPSPPPLVTGLGKTVFLWLYLRRPADATKPPSAFNPMVVVDSIRFPVFEAGYTVTPGTPPTASATMAAQSFYSLQRLQPYRGGELVPFTTTSGTPDWAAPNLLDCYGYSQQTAPPTTSSTWLLQYDQTNPKSTVTATVYQTLGAANTPTDTSWDYLTFHDRDFTSVAELLQVPGCPPGLFTKKFTEFAAPVASNSIWYPATSPFLLPPTAGYPTPPTTTGAPPTTGFGMAFPADAYGVTLPHTSPYLVDRFFYSAQGNIPATTPAPIGGPTNAGWYKMFEFFEVPSSSFGAIGQVAEGNNFDWARQDLKPGQLNLNLIIDEEVFFGLIDDPRLSLSQVNNIAQLPQIVTQARPGDLYPTATYHMQNRGFLHLDQNGNQNNFMKAAFRDFLVLRHGGSGYLFSWGFGPTGSGSATLGSNPNGANPVAFERPFHSSSYPDINLTVMRPATLPPTAYTTPVLNTTNPTQATATSPDPTAGQNPYCGDPGLMNIMYQPGNTNYDMRRPPAIPARRLFEVPDYFDRNVAALIATSATEPAPTNLSSNGSETGQWFVNQPTVLPFPALSMNPNGYADLFTPQVVTTGATGTTVTGVDLGSITAVSAGGITSPDLRQHPYYRGELMQRITNLTTVRTHQYAVWITVGFFEVVQQGNPAAGVPDVLGQEMGVLSGRNVRFRSFFIVDRTKATGFESPWPGVASDDFRDCVVYRRKIE